MQGRARQLPRDPHPSAAPRSAERVAFWDVFTLSLQELEVMDGMEKLLRFGQHAEAVGGVEGTNRQCKGSYPRCSFLPCGAPGQADGSSMHVCFVVVAVDIAVC